MWFTEKTVGNIVFDGKERRLLSLQGPASRAGSFPGVASAELSRRLVGVAFGGLRLESDTIS